MQSRRPIQLPVTELPALATTNKPIMPQPLHPRDLILVSFVKIL